MIFQVYLPYDDTVENQKKKDRSAGRLREKEKENGRLTFYYNENEIVIDILKFRLAVRLREHKQRKLEAFLVTRHSFDIVSAGPAVALVTIAFVKPCLKLKFCNEKLPYSTTPIL